MILNVQNLCISYSGHETVHNVSFSLEKGKILAIVGESGSGKTSIIRSLLGCLPHEGKVIGGTAAFGKKDIFQNTDQDWLAMSGTEIAMIFQDSGLMMNPIRTIGQQFIEYIRLHKKMTKKEATMAACSALKRMSLANPEDIIKQYPHELSGGMRQRVGVAMAMYFKPPLLLADEPTSALDVTTQAQVVEELMSICRENGTTIIIVTHNLGVASYMADYIMVMKQGECVEHGSACDVIDRPRHAYTKELLEAVPSIGGLYYAGQ